MNNTNPLLTTLTSQRLIITPLAPIHKKLYVELYTNEKIMRNIAKPLSVTQAQRCFDLAIKHNQSSPSKQLTWAIIAQQSGEAIGIQGLTFDKNNANEAEIGIMLSRNAHGKNFPCEAMGALTEFFLIYSDVEKINAIFASVNKATLRFVKKLNYVRNDNSPIYKNATNNEHYFITKHNCERCYLQNKEG